MNSESKDRHERETLSKIGKPLHVSRETIRKCGVVMNTFSDGEELIKSGKYRADKLYRLAIGDNRASLYVKIPQGLKETLKAEAKSLDVTMGDLITYYLTQIFGEDE